MSGVARGGGVRGIGELFIIVLTSGLTLKNRNINKEEIKSEENQTEFMWPLKIKQNTFSHTTYKCMQEVGACGEV